MAKECEITGKGSRLVGNYSNKTRATKFNPTGMVRKRPNIMKKTITLSDGTKKRIWITTKGMRTLKKY